MNNRIRVMLVEDHPEYREVIQLALEDEPDIELADQVGSSERALSVLQHSDHREMPDLILLDLNLPGDSGLDVLPAFRSITPETKIVILTQSGKEADVLRAIREGASGYLLKSSTVTQIVDAIRTVASGGAMLDSGVAKYVLDTLQSSVKQPELLHSLSQRELEILRLLSEGFVKKEVAHQLDISVSSVATYIRRIYEKLDVQNAPAAVNKAYRLGIFPTDGGN
ncbi:response regulator [Rhodopirellula sp. SWK7]|uniref:response regulator n=1 Tax=Rhodopirellula sp. SWK7 TaxID=595460 RepID=UPI0002BD784D|nr:response regulator transcription factor [Rhodopirellula sp. SWK7]EMI43286.1 two component transcriptional regulator, LuxR family [Rhodopirellula sp. SWK7]